MFGRVQPKALECLSSDQCGLWELIVRTVWEEDDGFGGRVVGWFGYVRW